MYKIKTKCIILKNLYQVILSSNTIKHSFPIRKKHHFNDFYHNIIINIRRDAHIPYFIS